MVNHTSLFIKSSNLLRPRGDDLLPMLAYCLMLAIVSLLTIEQEEQANHCQNINSSHNRAKIWLLKLLARDLIVILPCLILWGSIGYVINDVSYNFYSGSLTWFYLSFSIIFIIYLAYGQEKVLISLSHSWSVFLSFLLQIMLLWAISGFLSFCQLMLS